MSTEHTSSSTYQQYREHVSALVEFPCWYEGLPFHEQQRILDDHYNPSKTVEDMLCSLADDLDNK